MRDIVVRHKLRSPKAIKEMALFLISNVGVEFSYNSLAKTFGLGSTNSAIAFVSYLEDSYLLFTVSKFDYSLKKQAVNPKKIYSIDNGLAAVNSVSFSSNRGRMLENCVFLQLRRDGKQIFYFKEENECDFVVKEKNAITQAIQVCYDLNEENKKREIDGLIEALEKFDLSEGLILTYDQQDELEISVKNYHGSSCMALVWLKYFNQNMSFFWLSLVRKCRFQADSPGSNPGDRTLSDFDSAFDSSTIFRDHAIHLL